MVQWRNETGAKEEAGNGFPYEATGARDETNLDGDATYLARSCT